MTNAALSNPIFSDEAKARAHFEKLRWPNGPVCPHCGVVDNAAKVARDEANVEARKTAKKKVQREGLYYCRDCGGQFTATMGTLYEDSKIPLHKWMLATHLMNSCKRGISAAELQRLLGFGSYRTAWFMAMRIREGMAHAGTLPPMGGAGRVIEADETYHGRSNTLEPKKRSHPRSSKPHRDQRPKRAIVALVERGGEARIFHVAHADKETVSAIVRKNVDPASRLHTDESALYRGADAHAATHETVAHTKGEYARGDVNTNSVEGVFGQFKRGMTGIYQHCDEKYLHRYLSEFEFRHNHRAKLGYSDGERAAAAVEGVIGKRLTLRPLKAQTA